MNRMVLGVALSADKSQVVLIRKRKPDWMANKLNGIGGKIEEDEDALAAMVREFSEEAGYETDAAEWEQCGTLSGVDFHVTCFRRFSDDIYQLEPHGRVSNGEVVAVRRVASLKHDETVRPLIDVIAAAVNNRKIELVWS